MNIRPRLIIAAAIVLALAIGVFASSHEEMVRDAVSSDAALRAEAIAALRAEGSAGLEALFTAYNPEITAFLKSGEASERWNRIAFAIDSVAMQKDGYASHLFWFTDLDAAIAEAQLTGKPVLSLRMLGNLNEEYSCANSRFFRAILYSNSEIADYLRENYVLHWKSVRPVPKVTIDFGDGRKMERTLTGNSIHYILSDRGEVIDALPGLYGPESFLSSLRNARTFGRDVLVGASDYQRYPAIATYQAGIARAMRSKRDAAIRESGVKIGPEADPKSTKAVEISTIAVTKMVTEAPILRDLDDNFSRFEAQIDTETWKKVAAKYAGETTLDQPTLDFIRRQNRNSSGIAFERMIANLRTLVAIDSTRNDLILRPQIYTRLNRAARPALEAFNAEIYRDLFKTPDSDRWLGLYSDDVYTGLDGNGIR